MVKRRTIAATFIVFSVLGLVGFFGTKDAELSFEGREKAGVAKRKLKSFDARNPNWRAEARAELVRRRSLKREFTSQRRKRPRVLKDRDGVSGWLEGRVFYGTIAKPRPAGKVRVELQYGSQRLSQWSNASGVYHFDESAGAKVLTVYGSEGRSRSIDLTLLEKPVSVLPPIFLGEAVAGIKIDKSSGGLTRSETTAYTINDRSVSITVPEGVQFQEKAAGGLGVRRIHVSELPAKAPVDADSRFILNVFPPATISGAGATLKLPNINSFPPGSPQIVYGYHAGALPIHTDSGWTEHRGLVSADGTQVIVKGVHAFSPFMMQGAGALVTVNATGTVVLPKGSSNQQLVLMTSTGATTTLSATAGSVSYSLSSPYYENTSLQVYAFSQVLGLDVATASASLGDSDIISGGMNFGVTTLDLAIRNATAISGRVGMTVSGPMESSYRAHSVFIGGSVVGKSVNTFGQINAGFASVAHATVVEPSPIYWPLPGLRVNQSLVIRGLTSGLTSTTPGPVKIILNGVLHADSAVDPAGFQFSQGATPGTWLFSYKPATPLPEGKYVLYYVPTNRPQSSAITFSVDNSAPIILTSVTPPTGSAAGGDVVTVTGQGFLANASGLEVSIGGKEAATFSVINDTTLELTTPQNTNGAKDIVVSVRGNPTTLAGAFTYFIDSDGDGLTDSEEFSLGTNPHVTDTDGDGLTDGEEVILGTNPLRFDSDGDGVSDGAENMGGTNPLLADTFDPNANLARVGEAPYGDPVPSGITAKGRLQLINPRADTTTITDIRVSQDFDSNLFTIDTTPNLPLTLPQNAQLEVILTGQSTRLGLHRVDLEIDLTNSLGNITHIETVFVEVTARPDANIPEDLSFSVLPGESSTKVLIIENLSSGAGALTVDTPTISAPYSVDTSLFPITLAPGTLFSLPVTVQAGDYGTDPSGTLTFTVNELRSNNGFDEQVHTVTLSTTIRPGAVLDPDIAVALGGDEERVLVVEARYVGSTFKLQSTDLTIANFDNGAGGTTNILNGVSSTGLIKVNGVGPGITEVSIFQEGGPTPLLLNREEVTVSIPERVIRTVRGRIEFLDLPSGKIIKSHDNIAKNQFNHGTDPVLITVNNPPINTTYALFQIRDGRTYIYDLSTAQEERVINSPSAAGSVPGVEPIVTELVNSQTGQTDFIGVSITKDAQLRCFNILTGQTLGTANLSLNTPSKIAEDVDMLIHGDGTTANPKVLFVHTLEGKIFALDLPTLVNPQEIVVTPPLAKCQVAVDPQPWGDLVVFTDASGSNAFVGRGATPGSYTSFTRASRVETQGTRVVNADAPRPDLDPVFSSDGQFGLQEGFYGHTYVLDRRKLDPNGSLAGQNLTILKAPPFAFSQKGVEPVLARYDPNEGDINLRLSKARAIVAYSTGTVRIFALDKSKQWTFGPLSGAPGVPSGWIENIDIVLSNDEERVMLQTSDGTIRIVNLDDGRVLHTIPDPNLGVPVEGVDPVLTPDDKFLAVVTTSITNGTQAVIHGVHPSTFGDEFIVGSVPSPRLDVDLYLHSSGAWAALLGANGSIRQFNMSGQVIGSVSPTDPEAIALFDVDLVGNSQAKHNPDNDWVNNNQSINPDGTDNVDPPEDDFLPDPILDPPLPGLQDAAPGNPDDSQDGGGLTTPGQDSDPSAPSELEAVFCICVDQTINLTDSLGLPGNATVTISTAPIGSDTTILVVEQSAGFSDLILEGKNPGKAIVEVKTGVATDSPVQVTIFVIAPEKLDAHYQTTLLNSDNYEVNVSLAKKDEAKYLVLPCPKAMESLEFTATNCPRKCTNCISIEPPTGTGSADCQNVNVALTPDPAIPGTATGPFPLPQACKVYRAKLRCTATNQGLAPIFFFVTTLDNTNPVNGPRTGILNEAGTFSVNFCVPNPTNCPSDLPIEFITEARKTALKEMPDLLFWQVKAPSDTMFSVPFRQKTISVTPTEVGPYQIRVTFGGCVETINFVVSERKKSKYGPNGEQEPDQDPTTTGDPIVSHNGELMENGIDLVVPSRGIPFQWIRRYKSGVEYRGPLGNNWDFNYNEFLEFDDNNNDGEVDVVRHVSLNFLVTYTRVAPGPLGFQTPDGQYTRLRANADGSFELRKNRGDVHKFKGPNDLDVGRLERITDARGNFMTFVYVGGELTTIHDTFGRNYTLTWTGGKITKLKDFADREIVYEYYKETDADGLPGDLKSVRSPTVMGTPTGNDFPNGKITLYKYYKDQADSRLNHNIKSVTRPNEVEDGGDPSRIFTYGTDPTDPETFDRVITQIEGGVNATGIAAGGTWQYYYLNLNDGADPNDLTIVRRQSFVIDRNGNIEEFNFNSRSKLITKRVYTGRVNPSIRFPHPLQGRGPGLRSNFVAAPGHPGPDPSFYEWKFEYNRHGETTREIHPEGNEIQISYAHENDANPLRRGNLTEKIWIGDSNRAAPLQGAFAGVNERAITMTYEPWTNAVASITNERGNLPLYDGLDDNTDPDDPSQHTKTLSFDYQEMPQATVEAEFQKWGIVLPVGFAGKGDLNDNGVIGPIKGQMVLCQEPDATVLVWDGSQIVKTTQSSMTKTQYNSFGQVTKQIDDEENVTELFYYPGTDPDGNSDSPVIANVPQITADSSITGGLLKSKVRDTTTSAGRNSGNNPTPENRAQYARYNKYGQQTEFIDGRGIVTKCIRNELDQVVRKIKADSINDSLAPAGTSEQMKQESLAFRLGYVEDTFYDHNNNVIRKEIENRDSGTASMNPTFDVDLSYDILDRLVERSAEIDLSQQAVWQYRYDGNTNQVFVQKPEGNTVTRSYDERNFLFQTTVGANDPSISGTYTYAYDNNGNRRFVLDAEDSDQDADSLPESTETVYDRWDRIHKIIDAAGQFQRMEYDVAGFELKSELLGAVGGASPTRASPGALTLLKETRSIHDERGRKVRQDDVLFGQTQSGLQTVEGPVGGSSNGLITSLWERDRLNRLVRFVDDRGHDMRYQYNGLDEQTLMQTEEVASGKRNTVRSVYGRTGNLIRSIETEVLPNGAEETFTTVTLYDARNRPVRKTDPVGQTTYAAYDSRNFMVAFSDAKGPMIGTDPTGVTSLQINGTGNTVRMITDGLGRQVKMIQDLRPGGVGDNTPVFNDPSTPINPILTPTGLDTSNSENGDGQVTVQRFYDKNSRITGVADDNGNVTGFEYDARDRTIKQIFADNTEYSHTYDRDNNTIMSTDARGTVMNFTLDVLDRRIRSDFVRGPGVKGTTLSSAEYDGLNRTTKFFENNDPNLSSDDHTIVRTYDSLDNLIEEIQDGIRVQKQFDGVSNQVSVIYPSDSRSLDYSYDQLDRVNQVTLEFGNSVPLIAQTSYAGPGVRRVEESLGNGLTCSSDYDAKRRLTSWQVNQGSAVVTGRAYTYDRGDLRRSERFLERPQSGGFKSRVTDVDSLSRFVSRDTATLDANEQILGGLSESFTWKIDGVSNWKENTTPQGAENRTVNELNQIVGGAFTHDADGNRLSDANRNYVYDANSRLLEVWNADNTVQLEAYTYDTLNRRVTRRTGTGTPQEKTIRYVYDGAHAIEERVGNVVEAYNYYGEELDSLIARETVGNGLTWHHRDVVGSTTAITNQSGAAVEHYEYSPFGETLFLDASFQTVMDQGSPIKESARNNPFLFLGRRLDATGLHYFRDRFYDAKEGRFLGRDSNQDSLNVGNLYTYASNNPFNYIDPWGMSGQASNHAAYLKQLQKHSWAGTKGVAKGVLSGVWDAMNPFSIVGDLKAGIEFAGEVFTNPRKLLERFICMLKQLSSEEAAELLGEMLGGSLVDGAIGLLISALTGGAAAPLAAAKLVGRLLKVMKRGGKLIKKLIKKGRGAVRKVKCKLTGGACFVAGTLILLGNGDVTAIEKIQIGDRVQTKQFNQKPDSEPEIDEDWVVITVRIPSKSGNGDEDGECTLLRSKAWFDKHYSKEKNAVWLQFGETQTIGWYPVVSERKASEPKAGKGRLVLSTINRVVNNVFELKIIGQTETIKGTGNHKFWSEDRQDWVPLYALKLGERLLLKSAVNAHVEWVKRVAGKFRVYNFEVQGVHNYFVGSNGVLAHNNNDCNLLDEKTPSKKLYKGLTKEQGEIFDKGGPEELFVPENFEPLPGSTNKIHGADFATDPAAASEYARRGGGAVVVDVPRDVWNKMVKDGAVVPDINMTQGGAVTVKPEGFTKLSYLSKWERLANSTGCERFQEIFGKFRTK